MEPAFIQRYSNEELDLDLDLDSQQQNLEEMQEIDPKVYTAVDEIKQTLFAFKKQLFYDYVSNDNKHNASSIDAMAFFHALFLQCIGYWISMLDTRTIAKPIFTSKKNTRDFDSLSNAIEKIQKTSPDAKIIVYNMLFQFSLQHPFDLGVKKSNDVE
jgi:hypothetical protein